MSDGSFLTAAAALDHLHIYPENPVMQDAWRCFVLGAALQPNMREAFTHETGAAMPPDLPRPDLDSLILAAIAGNNAWGSFARWVTDAHWGIEFAPPELRAALGRN